MYFAEWQVLPSADEAAEDEFFNNELRPSFERQTSAGEKSIGNSSGQVLPRTGMNTPFNTPFAWIVLQIQNPTDQYVDRYLQLERYGSVNWYQVDGKGKVTSHQDDLSEERSGRLIFDPYPILPLENAPGETKQVYLGLFVSVSLMWNLMLWQEAVYLQDRLEAMMLDGCILD